MKKVWVLLSIFVFAIACDSKKTPKSQDLDGNCNQAFLQSYNKILSSDFEVTQQDNKANQTVVSDTCQLMMKTYGTESEACLATDLKTSQRVYLSTADAEIKAACAKQIKSKVFVTNPE